jgi:gliding motility-associated protein GldM
MASAKDSPRQKMIGMMYLVLTALLALNVTKDILDAFVIVNKGLEKSNQNFTERNEKLYADFDLAKTIDPVKVTPGWKKAQEIQKRSFELNSFIDDLQKQLIIKTEGVEKSVADTLQMQNIENKDDQNKPTNIMIGDSEDGSAGASRSLKEQLNSYKELLTSYIEPKDREKVKVDINTEDPTNVENNENWEMYNFYDRPLVASLTILSKLKNDVKNAESLVVDYLLKSTDAEVMKFDTIAAKVIPQSNYVLLGEEYKSDVFVAAFSKTKKPEIIIDGTEQITVENGLGKYIAKTNKEGIVDYSGTIKLISAKGKEVTFPFKSEYIVARPSLTVSADKMNVVYLGLENPISVSVPGIPNERLTVSTNNGTLKSAGNGKYILNVTQGSKLDVNVFATMENGDKRNMGSINFRVKRIPKPFAKFGDLIESGVMPKNVIASQFGLVAYYENFDFNIVPKIKSFTMAITVAGGSIELKSNSNLFTEEMKTQLKQVKKNQRIMFENIRAVGPDGIEVKLSPLTVKVN